MFQPTYSERKYENKLAFNYYNFPAGLREELLQIFCSHLDVEWRDVLMEELRRRTHRKYLGDLFGIAASLENFCRKAPSIYLLDAVEICLTLLFDIHKGEARAEDAVRPVIDSFNQAFNRFNVGFYVVGRVVVREDSRYYDAKVIRQVYELLFAAGFEEALANFQHALGWLRYDPMNFEAVQHYAEASLAETANELLRKHKDSGVTQNLPMHQALEQACRLSQLPPAAGAIVGEISAAFDRIMNACRAVQSTEGDLRWPEEGPCFSRFAVNMMAAGIMLLMQLNKNIVISGKLSEWDMFE